ncbi:hypothetical protein [Altererythrobacter sp. GH1-8]|uniref:hypothetical protein n=1 Tax=Altererythrobacter sp. GH1-8 TaxID=3349333 RepID=UPI00374DDC18
MKLLKSVAIACGTTALAFATPAAAQMQVYEDYTPSDEVVEMTTVKVDSGQFETYLEGLKSTWVAANEVAKELGHIKGYAIWGVPYGTNEVNLILTITYPSTAHTAPSKERYDEFMARWGEERMDSNNKTVLELYNKIREIKGVYLLRRIDVKTD